jgi:transcriptional regulator with XRE-family HTH domain
MRNNVHMSQPELAERLNTTQNQIYRLESPQRAKPTLTTLKKIAAFFDVGLVVRFVPYSEMIDYISGTPRLDTGIATARNHPLTFSQEFAVLNSFSEACVDDAKMLEAIKGQRSLEGQLEGGNQKHDQDQNQGRGRVIEMQQKKEASEEKKPELIRTSPGEDAYGAIRGHSRQSSTIR